MDFEGVVYRVLPQVKGQSARGEWVKQEVVLELPGEFSRKVCISFWGDKTQELASVKEGEVLSISVNVESKEYNGRWFTEVRGWRLSRKSPETGGPPAGDFPAFSVDDEPFAAGDDKVDDLPF